MKKSLGFDSTNRKQGLDCLRALASICVVVQHSTAWRTLPGGWAYGSYGVCLFCVLSGYLITHLLLVEEGRTNSISIREYLLRRALRILPPYFLMLVSWTSILKLGLYFRSRPDLVSHFFDNLPAFATFTHNWSGNLGDLGHLWSISVEEQYYICIPLLLALIKKRRLRVMVLLLALFLCWQFIVQAASNISHPNSAFLPLLLGSLLSVTWEQFDQCFNRSTSAAIFPFAIACLLTVSILGGLNPYGPVSSLSFVILVGWIVSNNLEIPKLKWLAYVGRISYGIYVYHATVILITAGILGIFHYKLSELAFVFLVILVCISVASLSFEFFERPIMNTRGRLCCIPAGGLVAILSPSLISIGVVARVYGYFF